MSVSSSATKASVENLIGIFKQSDTLDGSY